MPVDTNEPVVTPSVEHVAPDLDASQSIDGEGLRGGAVVDRVYDGVTTFFALCVPILLLVLLFEVARAGWPAFAKFGLGFLFTSDWDPVNLKFGALPAI